MDIQTPLIDGHYHFITKYAGHTFYMQNPEGIVFMDGNPIMSFIDGEYYINESGISVGWMSFEQAIQAYCDLTGITVI